MKNEFLTLFDKTVKTLVKSGKNRQASKTCQPWLKIYITFTDIKYNYKLKYFIFKKSDLNKKKIKKITNPDFNYQNNIIEMHSFMFEYVLVDI